jgi:dihydroflavonol-4-reductase
VIYFEESLFKEIFDFIKKNYMKILVTGATGFLGHHLVKRLVKDGYKVRILKEKESPIELIKGLDLEVFEGDIRDLGSVKKAVKGCEVVFHLAGLISYWSKQNLLQYEINVLGTKNIVRACLEEGVKRLVYTSSTAAIGFESGKLADEETKFNLWNLNISYCNTKYLAELEIKEGVKKGLDAVIVCPGSMYGEGDLRRLREDPVLPRGISSLFYVKGGLAVVDVEDVVEGEVMAWKKGKKGERYILVSENLSFYEIRKTISEALNKKPPKFYLPYPFFLVLAYILKWLSYLTGKRPRFTPENASFNKIYFYFSNEKAKKELGMKFRPFKKSVQSMISWYKEKRYL